MKPEEFITALDAAVHPYVQGTNPLEVSTSVAYLKFKILDAEDAEGGEGVPSFKAVSLSSQIKVLTGNPAITTYLEQFLTNQTKLAANLDKVLNALPNDKDCLVAIAKHGLLDQHYASLRYSMPTPQSVRDLALKVLAPTGTSVGNASARKQANVPDVLDMCCGSGSFAIEAASNLERANIEACDIDTTLLALAAMKSEMCGARVIFRKIDAFKVQSKYDIAFANFPFGIRDVQNVSEAVAQLQNDGTDDLPKTVSLDWLFALKLASLLKDDGRAVAIMAPGALFNGADAEMREYAVKAGLIEAVAYLPQKMLPGTQIACALVVLSRGNKAIRMVDASEIYHSGRRSNYLAEGDVKQILMLIGGKNSSISKQVDLDVLRDNDYSLDPRRYNQKAIKIANAVELGAMVEEITRGSSLNKAKLDEIHSDVPTGFRYLMLQDIEDGEIAQDLPYITGIERSQLKYCVHDGDVVLSKIVSGVNFKVAIAHVAPEEKLLATGNLYIIRPDKSRLLPEYLKLCLESEPCRQQLLREGVGSAALSVPIKALQVLKIPSASMDKQREIAKRYKALQKQIASHKRAIEAANEKLAALLLDEGVI